MNFDILTHILMFVVGIIILLGSVKYIMLSFEGQRGVAQAVVFGACGFLIGTALCVWAIVGTPD